MIKRLVIGYISKEQRDHIRVLIILGQEATDQQK